MSKQIDERVVEMRFDNQQFEANVKTSMSTLEKLKNSLKFDGASSGLEKLGSASKIDMGPLERSVDAVKTKFSALETIAVGALLNIGSQAVTAGEQMLKSLTVDNITMGWEKYNQKMANVQTIMNATGKSLEQVNAYLDELMWYSDETSYGFTDMTSALATMVSSGGDIEKVIPLIMGVANATAYSGKGATEFAMAMRQLVQSYSTGVLQSQDWRVMEQWGATSAKLKEVIIQTGEYLGLIEKGEVTVASFNSTLSDKWVTTEVLEQAYSSYATIMEDAYQLVQSGAFDTAAEALESLSDKYEDYVVAAAKSAQSAKSFAEAIDATKDAVSSGWSRTFEIIVGDYEQAVKLWSGVTETLWEVFAKEIDERNEVLDEALSSNYDQFADSISEVVKELEGLSDAELEAKGYTREQAEAFAALNQQIKEGNPELKEYIDSISRPSGRENLVQSLRNIRDALFLVDEETGKAVGLIAVLKEAWSEVFPLKTAEQIYEITEKIRDFTEMLIPSEERAAQLKSTFKGLFSLLDIGKQAIEAIVRVISPLIAEIFPGLANGVFSVTGSIGDWITNLSQALRENDTFYNGLSKVVDIVKAAATAIADFAKNIASKINFPSLDGLTESFSGLFSAIKLNFNQEGLDRIKEFIERVKGLDGISLDNIKKVFTDFKENVLGYFLNSSGAFDKVKETLHGFAENAKKSFSEISTFVDTAAVKIKGALGTLGQFLAEAQTKIIEFALTVREKFANTINFGDIMAAGIGVGIVAVLTKISNALKLLTAPLEGLGDVFEGFSKKLKAEALETRSKALNNFANAILKLVAALAVLTLLDQAKLGDAIAILAGLAGGLLAVQLAMVGINKLAGGTALGSLVKISAPLLSLAASILMLAKAMKSLDGLDSAGIDFAIISGLIAEMTAVAVVLQKSSKVLGEGQKGYSGSILTLIGFAASLKLLVSALKDIDNLQINDLGKTLGILLTSIGTLVLISKAGKNMSFSAGTGMLAAVVSIKLLASAFQSLGNLDASSIAKGITVITTVFGAMSVLALFSKDKSITQLKGDSLLSKSSSLESVGAAFMKMAAGMVLIVTSIKMMEGIDAAALERAKGVITQMFLVFTAVTAFSKLSGENAAKAGTMILAMSGAITLLSVAMALLSHLDPSGLNRALGAVTQLLVIFGVLVGVSKFAGEAEKAKGTLIALTVAIGVLVAAVAALALINPDNLTEATTAITVLLGALSLVIASTHLVENAKGILIVLGLVVAELAAVLGAMSALQVENALPNAAALGILITSMSAALLMLSKVNSVGKTSLAAAGLLGLVVAEIAAVLWGMSELNVEPSIETAASLSVLLLSMSAACAILSAVGSTGAAGFVGIGVLAALIATMGVVMAAISALTADNPTIEADLDRAIMVMEKIGTGLGAAIGGFIGGVFEGLTSSLPEIADNLSDFAEHLEPFLNKIGNVDSGIVEGVGNLAAALLIITAEDVVNHLTSSITRGKSVETFTSQLKPLAEGLVEFAETVDGIGSSDIEAAANAGKMLAEMAATIPDNGDSFSIISFITGKHNLDTFGEQLKTFGDALVEFAESVKDLETGDIEKAATAGKLMAELANDIPSSGDSLVSWIMGRKDLGTFGDQLKQFGDGLVDFANSVKDLDTSGVEKAQTAGKLMAELAKDIPSTENSLLGWIIGRQDLGTFGDQLKQFGEGMSGFVGEIGDLNTSNVENVAAAASMMAEMNKSIPNNGDSLLGWIEGKQDLSTFGTQLENFGRHLRAYAGYIVDVKPEAVTASAYAGQALADLANNLPQSSIFQQIFDGTETIATFGGHLVSFGNSMKSYYDSISGIQLDKMMGVTNRVKDLVALAEDVKSFDKNSFSNFTTAIKELGNTQFDNFVSAFESGTGDMKTAVQNVLNVIVDTITSNKTIGDAPMKDILNSIIKAINDKKTNITQSAKNLMLYFGNGIRDSESSLKNTVSTLISNLITFINGKKSSFYDAGVYSAQGYAQGIQSQKKAVETAGANMANNAKNGLTVEAAIKSPSKVFAELGGYTASGYVTGIESKLGDVKNAGAEMGNTASEALRDRMGIHSDSDDTIEAGQYTGSGYANGMTSMLGTVANAATNLGNAASNALNGAVETGLAKGQELIENFVPSLASIGNPLTELWSNTSGAIEALDIDRLSEFVDLGQTAEEIISGYDNTAMQARTNDMNAYTAAVNAATEATEELAEATDSLNNVGSYGSTRINANYQYMMQQLGEDMAIGFKNDIVPIAEALSDEMLAEITAFAGQGLETYKTWLEEKKYYGEISTYQELKGYELLQEQFEQGSKERQEIDKQIYTLENNLVAATYQYSLDWIEKEKDYNRLSKEEELAAYQRMLTRYAEGSDQQIALAKKIYDLEKEIAKERYDKAIEYVEEEVYYERMSTEQKLTYYKSLRAEFADGSDERKKLDKEIYTLEKTLAKENYQNAIDYIEEEVYYERIGTAEKLELYKKLRDEFKEGSEERKKIDKEIYQLEKDLLKERYDAAIAYIEEEVFYERMGTAEKLEYYKQLREEFAEGTEQRKKLDKEIYTLEKNLAKERYEEVTKYIEQEVFYERMGSEEKLKYLRAVRQEFKEGSEERIKLDKEIYTLEKTLAQEAYQSAIDWIEEKKYYNQLSTSQELYLYERLQSMYKEGSEERKKIDKQVYTLRNQLVNETYQNEMNWISQMKSAGSLNLMEELAAYQQLQSKYASGSEQRKNIDQQIASLEKQIAEAEKKYASDVANAQKSAEEKRVSAQESAAQKRLNAEQTYADKVKSINEQLVKDIETEQNRYLDSLESRTNTLYKSYGLFDAVDEKEDVDGSTLIANLEDQVKEFSEWQDALNTLTKRGVDEELIKELQEMGPSAVKEIQALAKMSDAELDKYVSLWSIKHAMARSQAVSELEDLRKETEENIVKLRENAEAELAEAAATLQSTLAQIDADLATELAQIESDLATKLAELEADYNSTVGSISAETASKLAELAALSEETLDDVNSTTQSELERLLQEIADKLDLIVNDVEDMVDESQEAVEDADWEGSGEEAVDNLTYGVESARDKFINALRELGLDSAEALIEAFDQMFDLDGSYIEDSVDEVTISSLDALRLLESQGLATVTDLNTKLSEMMDKKTGGVKISMKGFVKSIIGDISNGITNQMPELAEVLEQGIIGTAATAERSIDGDVTITGIGETFVETMGTAIEASVSSLEDSLEKGIIGTAIAIEKTVDGNEVVTEIGETLIDTVVDGVESATPNLESKLDDVIIGTASTMASELRGNSEWVTVGEGILNDVIQGIENIQYTFKNKLDDLVFGSATEVQSSLGYYSPWYTVGVNIVQGIINGIQDMEPLMITVISNMAWAAVAAVQAELGIYSPSRVTRELGAFTGMGFIEGLSDYADLSYDTAATVADSAKEGLSDAIMSISDYLSGDFDTEPTIRPVLDLTDITNGVGYIDGLFDNQRLFELVAQANLALSANEGESVVTVNVNNNDVVEELHSLRGDMNEMIDRIERMQVRLDSGALVGQIAGKMDAEFGRRMAYKGRGI